MAKLLQLDGLGPFETPAVAGFLGLAIAQGREPTQIRFVLEDGSELRLPIQGHAFEKLASQFAAIYEQIQQEKN